MHAKAAARMRVQSRSRNPLPLEETERRLEGVEQPEARALILHNAGYTEVSFRDGIHRREWAEMLARWSRGCKPAPKRMHRKARRTRSVSGWV